MGRKRTQSQPFNLWEQKHRVEQESGRDSIEGVSKNIRQMEAEFDELVKTTMKTEMEHERRENERLWHTNEELAARSFAEKSVLRAHCEWLKKENAALKEKIRDLNTGD